MSKMCFIASASIGVLTEYKHMDAIVEYFKDHAVYKYCTDLTMDGQLKFKGNQL